MAEGGTEVIELENREAEAKAEMAEGEETSFTDQQPRDTSLLIINGLGPEFVRTGPDVGLEIPNVGRDAGVMRRYVIHDKKEFIKKGLGISLNKGDGPSSTKIFDELRVIRSKDGNKINGATFRDKKIIILKNGQMKYSTSKNMEREVNEFKELLKRAKKEHARTSTALVEENLEADVTPEVMADITRDVGDRIDASVDDKINSVTNNTEITDNELSELRGILNAKGRTEEEKIEYLDIEEKHQRAKAEEERVGGNNKRVLLYDAIADVAKLKADGERLKINLRPESEEVESMVKEEAKTNPLGRLERFKEWAKDNIPGLSAVSISVAGIITTVVMGAKQAIKKGADSVKKFAKAVKNLAGKAGPVIAGVLNVVAKVLEWGAKGLGFLAQNLWILALALTYFVYNEYKDYRNQRTVRRA